MKIVWIDKPMQDDNTMEPQLIDGVRYNWCVKTRKLNCTSLQEELQQWKESGVHSDAKYILIHEVMSVEKLFCDQDCKPNEPGCREKYIKDNHALMLRYDVILNQN
jgi:hypothetical protein